MTINEIRHRLGEMPTTPATQELVSLVLNLCEEVSRLEGLILANERATRAAANTASCLANGMLPD